MVVGGAGSAYSELIVAPCGVSRNCHSLVGASNKTLFLGGYS